MLLKPRVSAALEMKATSAMAALLTLFKLEKCLAGGKDSRVSVSRLTSNTIEAW